MHIFKHTTFIISFYHSRESNQERNQLTIFVVFIPVNVSHWLTAMWVVLSDKVYTGNTKYILIPHWKVKYFVYFRVQSYHVPASLSFLISENTRRANACKRQNRKIRKTMVGFNTQKDWSQSQTQRTPLEDSHRVPRPPVTSARMWQQKPTPSHFTHTHGHTRGEQFWNQWGTVLKPVGNSSETSLNI